MTTSDKRCSPYQPADTEGNDKECRLEQIREEPTPRCNHGDTRWKLRARCRDETFHWERDEPEAEVRSKIPDLSSRARETVLEKLLGLARELVGVFCVPCRTSANRQPSE